MIGIDLVSIKRFESFVERFSDRALKKYLTDDEIALAKSIKSYAGFWAAKEAISKALGTGIGKECSFFDIKIKKTSKGAPYFLLSKKIIKKYNITQTSLSITHDGDYVIAVCEIKSSIDKEKDLSF